MEKVSTYVLSCNAPTQLQHFLGALYKYDQCFFTKTDVIIIDQSSEIDLEAEYIKICNLFEVKRIKCENRGCSGGRHTAAELFHKTDANSMFFFEDDMIMAGGPLKYCRFGMKNVVDNIVDNTYEIVNNEKLDYLKFSFHEIFNNHSNVWPMDGKTLFTKIESHNNIPYLIGEIYFSNWPLIITQAGSRKLFGGSIEEEHNIAKKSILMIRDKKLLAGVLSAWPINHHRIQEIKNHIR